MYIKNKSKNEWKDYNCGDEFFITIKPESVFEVPDKYGKVLLRNLGSDSWLIETAEPEKKKTTVEKVVEKVIKKEEVKKEKTNKFKK